MNIIIWGTGEYGKKCKNSLEKQGLKVIAFTDSSNNCSTIEGINSIPYKKITDYKFDFLIIAVSNLSASLDIEKKIKQLDGKIKTIRLSNFTSSFILKKIEQVNLSDIYQIQYERAKETCSLKINEKFNFHQGISLRHFHMLNTLQNLLIDKKEVTIIEIGSWLGESLALWSEELKNHNIKSHIICVDLWDTFISKEDALNKTEGDVIYEMNKALKEEEGTPIKIFNTIKSIIENENKNIKISFFKGFSQDFLDIAQDEIADLIYIDASHYYKDVLIDIEKSKRLLKNNGILCGDDLEVEANNKKVIEICKKNKEKDIVEFECSDGYFHPGVSLALLDSKIPYKNYYGFWVSKKVNGKFFPFNISLSKKTIPRKLVNSEYFDTYFREMKILNTLY